MSGKKKISVTEQTQKRAKGKKKPRGKPFSQGNTANPAPFKSKEELGGHVDPRINVGGRPKLLGESYTKVLASPYPTDDLDDAEKARIAQYTAYIGEPGTVVNHAEVVALRMARMAAMGDVRAASEIRVSTEGARLRLETWQTEIVEALKRGELTPQEIVSEIGIEDARPILVAAGTPLVPPAPAQAH